MTSAEALMSLTDELFLRAAAVSGIPTVDCSAKTLHLTPNGKTSMLCEVWVSQGFMTWAVVLKITCENAGFVVFEACFGSFSTNSSYSWNLKNVSVQ